MIKFLILMLYINWERAKLFSNFQMKLVAEILYLRSCKIKNSNTNSDLINHVFH